MRDGQPLARWIADGYTPEKLKAWLDANGLAGQLCRDFFCSNPFSLSVVTKLTIAPGVFLWREKFSPIEQKKLLDDVMARLEQAPLYRPVMPDTGKPFSVEESNFGKLGWVSDKSGYRYQPAHPVTGEPWPDIPRAAAGSVGGDQFGAGAGMLPGQFLSRRREDGTAPGP